MKLSQDHSSSGFMKQPYSVISLFLLEKSKSHGNLQIVINTLFYILGHTEIRLIFNLNILFFFVKQNNCFNMFFWEKVFYI